MLGFETLSRYVTSLQRFYCVFFFRLFLLFLSVNFAFAKSDGVTFVEENISAVQAQQAFRKGDFEQAIVLWTTMLQRFARQRNVDEQITAIFQLSDSYQAMGRYSAAIAVLNNAYRLNEKSGNRQHKISRLNRLGALYSAIGEYDKASSLLQQAIDQARAVNQTGLLAATLNNQGNLYARQKQYELAVKAYAESVQLADVSGHYQLAAKASINSVVASMAMGVFGNTQLMLTAQKYLNQTKDDHDKAYHWVALGKIALQLSHRSNTQSPWQSFAYHAFTQATAIAKESSDKRALSYSTGYLGELYLQNQRYDEALQLTRQAVFVIESISAPEIVYRWQWQIARILTAKGDYNAAIQAYQQAINTLQPVRQDLATKHFNDASFREEIRPLYLQLTDLLLQSNDTKTDPKIVQTNLRAARNIMEQLKAAELQDYFKDDCVVAMQKKVRSLETIDHQTAAIYPILLDDRTEILLSLPGGIQRFTSRVGRSEITRQIRLFRHNLENRTTREYLPQAQQLYQWLIAPLQSTLDRHKVKTLIVVPDDSLRTIPLAALHDGDQFLIERYAITNTPGLSLTDPKALDSENIHILASGLSQAVQGFSPLPYVAKELASIHKTLGGQILLDDAFLLDNVEKELKKKPYTIVHIASHGQFESNTQENFILTYDNKITMDTLEQLIGLGKFRDQPVELLVLSACQTATGDDRAALGLAGIAIKAGARSAIATLWFINDRAASDLVAEFYSQLKVKHLSKAQALQQAQVYLINNTGNTAYRHPYFWSPFLLIGNWL